MDVPHFNPGFLHFAISVLARQIVTCSGHLSTQQLRSNYSLRIVRVMEGYTESWLQLEAATGGRVALQGSASAMRDQFAGLIAALSPNYPAIPDGIKTFDGVVDGVPYRVYCPRQASQASPLPIGIFLHGGGLVLGDLECEHMLCHTLCEQSNTVLVSVDYRLAPEHKHPAQMQDTITVLEWAYANAPSFGGDAERLYTIGSSAGGTLALLAAREIMLGRSKVPGNSLRGVVTVGPVTVHPDNVPSQFQADYKSYTDFGEGAPVITRATMTSFLEFAGMAPDDPSCFLLLDRESLSKFPLVYIATTGCDPLRDDGRALASALRDAGVRVWEDSYPGLPHAFWYFNTLPEFQGFIRDTVAGINLVLNADASK
ncbi:Alpha/Beta hydrolase protein [Aspergillus unguis]